MALEGYERAWVDQVVPGQPSADQRTALARLQLDWARMSDDDWAAVRKALGGEAGEFGAAGLAEAKRRYPEKYARTGGA